MINFRFHLVSLIAVFLALGLGILVGSTVVDQGIVNRLDSAIDRVSKENGARKATNALLSKENNQLEEFIKDVAPFAGDARLDALSIAIVAERGVSSDVAKQTKAALLAAGADVPGILWLDDAWQLDTEARVQDLQSALEVSGSATATRDEALAMLTARLGKAPASNTTSTSRPSSSSTPSSSSRPSSSSAGGTTTTSTSVPKPPEVDALTALEDAGFLSVTDGDVSGFDAFPTHVANVLYITGDDSHFVGADLTAAFVRALVDLKLSTVVGAAYDGGDNAAEAPKRGAALASVLDDRVLSRAAATVDDLDLVQGRVAAVLSFETIGSGSVGHYGYGSGASAPLPPHRS